jgi:hypothetical protein
MANIKAPPSGKLRPAAVYLLQRVDRSRFKLGWALNPMRRLQAFPEFSGQQLDLGASRVLWLPNAHRARALERAMHKTLAPFRTRPLHHGDGHTEWFQGSATVPALSLLAQVPHAPGERPASVMPLLDPLTEPEPMGLDETWSAMEDVWLRLLACTTIRICNGEHPTVRVEDFKTRVAGPLLDLRLAALDADLYTCRDGSGVRPIVRLIAYEGDDLLLTLTPLQVIRRWPGGGAVALQLQAFMSSLSGSAKGGA